MSSRDRFASRMSELARLLRESKDPATVDRVAADLERMAALSGQ